MLVDFQNIAEAMRQFGGLARSPSVKDLRQEALGLLRDHPLQGIMPMSQIDHEGKPAARSPAADMNGEQMEEWYRPHILHSEQIRRQRSVAGDHGTRAPHHPIPFSY